MCIRDRYSSASVPIPQKKGIGKLLVRLELDEGASVKIEMQFDSDGVWREVKTLQAEKKRSFYLPIVPRRCDHFRIRMTGSGGCRLYSLVREVYTCLLYTSQPLFQRVHALVRAQLPSGRHPHGGVCMSYTKIGTEWRGSYITAYGLSLIHLSRLSQKSYNSGNEKRDCRRAALLFGQGAEKVDTS